MTKVVGHILKLNANMYSTTEYQRLYMAVVAEIIW